MLESKDIVRCLFQNYRKEQILSVEMIAQAGSAREYFRIFYDGGTAIGVVGNNVAENLTFLYFTRQLLLNNISVPQIIAVADDSLSYILSDVGTVSLLDFIEQSRAKHENDSVIIDVYKNVLSKLIEIQVVAGKNIDYSKCLVRQSFDEQQLYFDLNYFKYYFLKLTELPFDEQKLENDFQTFIRFIGTTVEPFFMYRDFQARNIFIKDGEPYFIDYQGGMKGPLQYDVASLLFQSRAGLHDSMRGQLLSFYIEELQKYIEFDKKEFEDRYYAIVLIRTLQTLGAYGFRGLIQKKTLFIKSIPQAIEILEKVVGKIDSKIEIPYFVSILKQLMQKEIIDKIMQKKRLKVTVSSFSFKRGIPVDTTGNGGGFVFDCRAITNPGKYDEYKALTGKDESVIQFLEENGEIIGFLDDARAMVSRSVERYINREFDNLMVNFGCTGGRHRSVYCAEKMTDYLRQKYDIEVELIHQEKATW